MKKTFDLTLGIEQPNIQEVFNNAEIKSSFCDSTIGNNTILKAVAPIINYVTHVCNTNNKYRKNSVNVILKKEITCFMKKLEADYKPDVILAARHIICSWCYDIIKNSDWGRKKKWTPPTISNAGNCETWQGENFFVIIQRCAKNPPEHQDLLQLCYCCMTLGYAGIYRNDEKGHIICYTIIDKIWDLISNDVESANHLKEIKTTEVDTNKPKIIWFFLLMITLISVIAIFLLEFRLMQVTKPVLGYLQQNITSQNMIIKNNL
jgi:type VI secretion system protein ImpK